MGLPNFIYAEMDFFKVGVFAAGAVSGVGEHGDSGLVIGIFEKSCGSVFDDGVKLLLGRGFIDTAIGEGDDAIAFFANKTAREISRFERKVVFVGEKDIARRVVKARNHGVGCSSFY